MVTKRWNLLPSHELLEAPIPDQYFTYADAYLDSAERLCRTLALSTRKATFQRGAVVLFLAQHGLELFYKGAILKRKPTERHNHGLPKLQDRYHALYPGKRFAVRQLFRPSYEGLSKDQIAQVQGLEPPTDQLFRYPEDKKGKPWFGLYAFEASSFSRELAGLRSEIAAARKQIDG